MIVSRVDVLTGGASSVYGADAVAGVVNFIMDTDFEGIRLDASTASTSTRTTPTTASSSALNAPRLRLSDRQRRRRRHLRPQPRDRRRLRRRPRPRHRLCRLPQASNAVLQGKRDYSACALTARTPAQVAANPARLYICGGSATSANGTFFDSTGGTSTFFQVGPNRTLIPGFTPYNFAPTNYFQRPDERYTAGAFAEYEISRGAAAVSRSHVHGRPHGRPDRAVGRLRQHARRSTATRPAPRRVNAPGVGNPLLSAQQRAHPLRRREPARRPAASAVDSGPAVPPPAGLHRSDDRPALYPRLRADPAPQRRRRRPPGRPAAHQLSHRRRHARRPQRRLVVRRLLSVSAGPTSPRPTRTTSRSPASPARSTSSTIRTRRASIRSAARCSTAPTRTACPGTSSRTGQVSPAALAYLQTPGFQRGNDQQTVASASLTGNLGEWGIQFPWAKSGVGIALGVEYRKERLDCQTDIAFQTGDLAGQGAPTLPVSGEFDVREAFAEVRIPIVEDELHPRAARSRPAIATRIMASRDRSFTTDTYKIGRLLRADPGHPLPRRLQPRRPRAEHPGAVRAAARRARRHRPIRAPAPSSPAGQRSPPAQAHWA